MSKDAKIEELERRVKYLEDVVGIVTLTSENISTAVPAGTPVCGCCGQKVTHNIVNPNYKY